MAHFEQGLFPNLCNFAITDDTGQTSHLTTEQAYELYVWLHERSDEMFQTLHPPLDQAAITLEFVRTPGKARHEETPQQKQEFELFPPRTIHHVSPAQTIADILRTIEGVQHPLSEETQAALDEIVNEQRRRLQGHPEQKGDEE